MKAHALGRVEIEVLGLAAMVRKLSEPWPAAARRWTSTTLREDAWRCWTCKVTQRFGAERCAACGARVQGFDLRPPPGCDPVGEDRFATVRAKMAAAAKIPRDIMFPEVTARRSAVRAISRGTADRAHSWMPSIKRVAPIALRFGPGAPGGAQVRTFTRTELGTIASRYAAPGPHRSECNRHDVRRWLRAFRQVALIASDALEANRLLTARGVLMTVISAEDADAMLALPPGTGRRARRRMATVARNAVAHQLAGYVNAGVLSPEDVVDHAIVPPRQLEVTAQVRLDALPVLGMPVVIAGGYLMNTTVDDVNSIGILARLSISASENAADFVTARALIRQTQQTPWITPPAGRAAGDLAMPEDDLLARLRERLPSPHDPIEAARLAAAMLDGVEIVRARLVGEYEARVLYIGSALEEDVEAAVLNGSVGGFRFQVARVDGFMVSLLRADDAAGVPPQDTAARISAGSLQRADEWALAIEWVTDETTVAISAGRREGEHRG